MTKFLITLMLLFSISSFSQDFIFDEYGWDFNKHNESTKNYKIYQYLDNDSTNSKLAKTVKFDKRGNKIFESTNNYKFSKLTAIENHITNSFFTNDLLTKTETTYPNSIDKYYSSFKYNNKKQLTSIVSKKFKKGLRSKVEKTAEGELLFGESFETRAKWSIDLKKYFKYDKLGRLIKTTIPDKFKKSQNIYHYYYLSENNPIKVSSYDRERLVWDEYREYHNLNDYDYVRIWPDYDFKISQICKSIGKVSFKFNIQNKLIEISQPDRAGVSGDMKIRFSYNKNDQLKRVEIISVDNQVELTSLYVYD